ncbi:MAG: hypothetical protein KAT29_14350, partial [Anaerolineales bacterium]|nr:hypothetical protein [Anaerolineales bacterium]
GDNQDKRETRETNFEDSLSEEFAFIEDGHLSEAAAREGLIFGVDQWSGSLPAFPGGTNVFYQLSAETGDTTLQSRIYEYTVRKEITLNKITNILHGQNSLVLILENPEEEICGYLLFHAAADGHLQIMTGHGEYPIQEKRELIQTDLSGVSSFTKELGEITLHVDINVFHIQILYQDNLVFKGMNAPRVIVGSEGMIETAGLSFDCPLNEDFYGFGERFNALNQRGQRLDVRVYDQYKNQGLRTYIPMPLFLSSRGYGLLVHSRRYTIVDLAQSNPNRWTMETELGDDNSVTFDILLGNPASLLDIIGRLNGLTGRPTLPPDWAFGLWMSSNEWNTQARVEEMMAQSEQHEIPATVIVLEAWSDENTFYIWNDARYSHKPGAEGFCYPDFDFPGDGKWPDPKGMVEKLHKQGLRLLLWQIPVLKSNEDDHAQLANDWEHMLEQGYCVHTEENTPYLVRPYWFRDGLLMDFTNQQGVEWWMRKRAYLLDEIGIDGFKTDGGEHIWGRDLIFADGRRSDEIWNEYPNLYVGAYFHFAQKYKTDAITFSRAGFTGAQAFPCHWAGDENSTWEAFQSSILAGLNAGVSGVPFWGWDFAGFSGEIPTAELYLRAAAMATFCPIMQYHSEYNHHRQPCNDRTPWNIAERTNNPDVLHIFRYFPRLRMNLLPYILHAAKQSASTGLPMMRALCLAYPQDKELAAYPYQYMFGESILVAPIVQPDLPEAEVYLPEGDWYSLWDDQLYPGGSVYKLPTSLEQIPVFVRANSLLPLNLDSTYRLGSDVGNGLDVREKLCFKLYPTTTCRLSWYDETEQDEFCFVWDEISPNKFVLRVLALSCPVVLILPEGFVIDQKTADKSSAENILALTDTSLKGIEVSVLVDTGGK